MVMSGGAAAWTWAAGGSPGPLAYGTFSGGLIAFVVGMLRLRRARG
jgi:hypothetical protein